MLEVDRDMDRILRGGSPASMRFEDGRTKGSGNRRLGYIEVFSNESDTENALALRDQHIEGEQTLIAPDPNIYMSCLTY